MHIVNIGSAMRMKVNELKDFIYKKYHKIVGFDKENTCYLLKRQKNRICIICNQINKKKTLDASNAKECYQSYFKVKNKTLVKQPKITAYQPKTLENPNYVGIKSVIIEYIKTSHKLSKTIKQATNLSQVTSAKKNSYSPFYNERKKR